jgi:DNA-binding CsgD family transcriptional regulator
LVKQIIISKNSPSLYASNFTASAIERCVLEQPYNKSRLSEIACGIKAIAGIVDAPNPSIGLWIYRTDIKSAVFDEKEITILQNIRPYLLLAIKAVIFQEERSAYSSIIQNLLASAKPEAIIKYDGSIVVCNDKLTDQIRQVGLSALPFRLRLKIKSLIKGQLSSGNLQHELAYYHLKRRLYAITLKPVDIKMNLSECTWLLTLTRLSNTTSLLIRTLNEANLTRRETEVVLCLQKGLSSADIAEKLSLSYHTVRTHLKNIYKKLNISSVRELMAFLLKHSPN